MVINNIGSIRLTFGGQAGDVEGKKYSRQFSFFQEVSSSVLFLFAIS